MGGGGADGAGRWSVIKLYFKAGGKDWAAACVLKGGREWPQDGSYFHWSARMGQLAGCCCILDHTTPCRGGESGGRGRGGRGGRLWYLNHHKLQPSPPPSRPNAVYIGWLSMYKLARVEFLKFGSTI